MEPARRNNVQILGDGPTTLVFAHGFGCDQNMWRLVAPKFTGRFRVVLFDLTGSGQSDVAAYRPDKYSSLDGYAEDLVEIIRSITSDPVVFVGHSVSAMIGVLAEANAPGLISAHIMIGPSPCYIDADGYEGGFSRDDILSLLDTLGSNYLGWSSAMAPVIMGAPTQPALAEELTNSFCRADPDIARQFANVTFLSDHRAGLAAVSIPTLIVQSSDDVIAPQAVGAYMHRAIAGSTLVEIENVGHCPHLSEPAATVAAMETFIAELERRHVIP